ncbi:DUF305 domain-containing protein [Allohahella marinimesophila]|uniref:DUF305 domain-containing protein n=1 Tax=Allohahella marinimesophila TaxID=1054972 RepID=A0ABP7PQI7_9GAMM
MDESFGHYWRFAAMVATATVIMYGLMYLNTYEFGHVRFSETRLYMTIIMGATMAIVMLLFMLHMYTNRLINSVIIIGSGLTFLIALWLVRSQSTVGDDLYMKAMIPHHSIALLTSERAAIEDVRVRTLADRIMTSQRKEIREMEWLIEDISRNGLASTHAKAISRAMPEFAGEP